jgi:hypothetical protein
MEEWEAQEALEGEVELVALEVLAVLVALVV